MRLLFLMTVALSFNLSVPLWGEDHAGVVSNSSRPSAASAPQSRLFDYLSACLAGRPIDPSIASPSNPPAVTQSGVATSRGESVFRSSCLKCHNGGTTNAPNFTLLNSTSAGKSITAINNGTMPKDRSPISPADKAELIKYLQSIK
ncbi:MAG: cytochrome c [Bdellovibrionales bacterium]|nr:cytochrome c [Bdellovibrionales bacterium]